MRHKSRSPKAHKNVDYSQLYTHSHSVPIHISSLASFIATSFASHSCLLEINTRCKFSKSTILRFHDCHKYRDLDSKIFMQILLFNRFSLTPYISSTMEQLKLPIWFYVHISMKDEDFNRGLKSK